MLRLDRHRWDIPNENRVVVSTHVHVARYVRRIFMDFETLPNRGPRNKILLPKANRSTKSIYDAAFNIDTVRYDERSGSTSYDSIEYTRV